MSVPFDSRRAQFLIDSLKPERLTRIVDIGANPINDCPYGDLLAIGGCEVVGFEPQKEALEELLKSKGPNETYLPYAVGAGEVSQLNITLQSGFTSLLEPNPEAIAFLGRYSRGMRVTETLDIETKRLDEIEELPDFDLLKIDIQGGERDVFRSGFNKLRAALSVITEVAAIPLYKDQPLIDSQMSSLRSLGYHLHKFLFLEDVRINNAISSALPPRFFKSQLTDGDAVFIRDLLNMAEMTDEEVKHLAILSDAVFKSFDLVCECLSHLVARKVINKKVADAYVQMVLDPENIKETEK
jgi:FkbM family methyltransferase